MVFKIRLVGVGDNEILSYTQYFISILSTALGDRIDVITDNTMSDLDIVLYPFRSEFPARRKILLVAEATNPVPDDPNALQMIRAESQWGIVRYDDYVILGCVPPGPRFWPFAAWCNPMSGSPEQVITERNMRRQVPKTRFCSVVRVHGDGPERNRLFELLSAYKRIDSAGPWNNNMPDGWKVPGIHNGELLREFYSAGKFVLACENTQCPGYITEKIMNAFRSGSVPIYWGTADIDEVFNPDAYINMNKFPNMEAVVEHIKMLDNNAAAYHKMLMAPLWASTPHTAMTSAPFINAIRSLFPVFFNKRTTVGYVINLARRDDRWSTLKEACKSLTSLRIERFEAIKNEKGAIGCAQSQMELVRMAKEEDLPYIIILEDDVSIADDFDERFPKIIKWLTDHMDDWELFNAGPHVVKAFNVLNVVGSEISLIKIDTGYGFQFIIHNRNTYDRTLSFDPTNAAKPDSAIDVFLSRNCYQLTVVPFLATQHPGISDICKGYYDYSDNFALAEREIRDGMTSTVPRIPVAYAINLQEAQGRWARLKQDFNKITALRILRVEAIRRPGFEGCFLSHQAIVRMAKNRKMPYVIIIEDDCYITNPTEFNKKFPQIIERLEEHLDGWNIFNAAPTYVEGSENILGVIASDLDLVEIKHGCAAHFIIYNANIFDWILEQKPTQPLDALIYNQFPQLTTYPYMALQHAGMSAIQGQHMDYSNIFKSSEDVIKAYLSK